MAINDKAAKLLSNATDAKAVLKIVKGLKGLLPAKVKGLAEQVASGSGFGRIKMTALNIIRGAINRGEFGKDLPAKSDKKPAKKVAKKAAKKTTKKADKPQRVSRRG